MIEERAHLSDPALADALRSIERRLARVEQQLRLEPLGAPDDAPRDPSLHAETTHADVGASAHTTDHDLEFMVGQNWLASVGILVLTFGVGFALLLPLAGLPPYLPSLIGGGVAGVLLFLSFRLRTLFELVAGYFRGAGMALLYFSVLRLFFFGDQHVLAIDSMAGPVLLSAVVLANIAAALTLRSAWLLTIALFTGFFTVVVIGAPWFVFVGTALLLGVGAWAVVTFEWPWLQLFLIPAGTLAHLLWMMNRPWQGRSMELLAKPAAGVYFVLVYVAINAMATYLRHDHSDEEPSTIVAVLLNCGAGFALFMLATLAAAPAVFGPAHLVATAVFLGLAVAFYLREASRISTFFYAMTGYLALSVALSKLIPVPTLFIWLSAQSLLVVATALLFRSRLIVVGNFFIYAGIVCAYVTVAENESGISIGFGIVALLTARILRWQQDRLELKSEMTRNAYLASAFLVFPYSLYHLVSRSFVSVAWVGIAVAYYLMNLVVRSPKYRWMGHLTLLLTALYMIVVGIFQLAPAYRIASFLVLGSVLLVVSLVFTMVRARRREAREDQR